MSLNKQHGFSSDSVLSCCLPDIVLSPNYRSDPRGLTTMYDMRDLREAILVGDGQAAVAATRKALDAGVRPLDIIGEGISPAMGEVGKLFEEGEYFVPELLIAAKATKEIFQILRPLLAETGTRPTAHV